MTKRDFHQLWAEGRTPWDTGVVDDNLVRAVEEGLLPRGRILDLGCGSGTDALWLAGQGFAVTGVDMVAAPLELARRRAADAGAACTFLEGRFPAETVPGAPFDCAYDRGCFHSQADDAAMAAFARGVAEHLEAGGVWFSIVGSCDDPDPGDPGPPRLTATQVCAAVEPFFTVERLVRAWIVSNRGQRHWGWTCLFRRR